MSIGKYYVQGLRAAARQPKMVFILWLVNALVGLAVYFQAAGLIRRAFGSSLWAETLNERFVVRGILELIQRHGRDVAALGGTVLFMTMATLLLSLFLSGGVLRLLTNDALQPGRREDDGAAARFFQGAGKTFGRFLRLEIYALSMWVVFAVLFLILAAAVGSLMDESGDELLSFWLGLVLAGAAAFFWLVGRMVIDYARIRIVVTDTREVLKTFGRAAAFVLRKIFKLLGLYFLFLLTTAAAYAAGEAAGHYLHGRTTVMVCLFFGVQQVLLLVLLSVRVALQAGQVRLNLAEGGSGPGLSSAAKDPGGQPEHRPDQVQDAVHGDAQKPEGQKEEPDEGIKDQGQQGQRPAEK